MAAVVLVTLTLVVTVPGLAVGRALRLRGWLLAAVAPLLTYGIVAAAGSALPLIGIRWSPLVLAGVTAVLATAAWPVCRRRRDDDRAADLPVWSRVHHLGIAVAVAVGALVGLAVSYRATAGFSAVPQVWDVVWHSNATHFIAETGLSHPSALKSLNDPATPGFYYPNTYHVAAATVVMITGAPVVTVIDVSVGVFTGLLALGMAALVRQNGGRPALAAATAVLSCAFTAFPYDLLPWGTLLPFNTAVSLLPGFLALLTAVLARRGDPLGLPLGLGLAALGLLGLHPSVIIAAVPLGVVLLVGTWLDRRPRAADIGALAVAAGAAAVLGGPLLLASSRAAAGTAHDWPAGMLAADALGQLLFLGHEQTYPQYWLVLLAVLGLVFRGAVRPVLWYVAGSTLFAVLFVMAASYEGTLVAVLTRPWWNDKWRFAGLWSLAVVLLAAGGLVAVRDGVVRLAERVFPALRRVTERRRVAVSVAALTGVTLVVAVVTNGLYFTRNETRLAQAFADGPTVSPHEVRAFDRLAELVPEGTLVMNDPYDGSALMYALTDVRPVFASPLVPPYDIDAMGPDRRVLFESFNRIDTDVAVQEAVRHLNVGYVIACKGFIPPANEPAPGMRGIGTQRSLTSVYENADARVYRIDLTRATARPNS